MCSRRVQRGLTPTLRGLGGSADGRKGRGHCSGGLRGRRAMHSPLAQVPLQRFVRHKPLFLRDLNQEARLFSGSTRLSKHKGVGRRRAIQARIRRSHGIQPDRHCRTNSAGDFEPRSRPTLDRRKGQKNNAESRAVPNANVKGLGRFGRRPKGARALLAAFEADMQSARR